MCPCAQCETCLCHKPEDMSNWIEVPIFCNTKKTSELKDLGIDVDDSEFEVRQGIIDVYKICGCYPSGSTDTTIINMLCGSVFEIDLNFASFKLLLKIKLFA